MMTRWLARVILLVLFSAAAFGLWQIPVNRTGGDTVWPLHHIHHAALSVLVGMGWVILFAVAVVGIYWMVYFLWRKAK